MKKIFTLIATALMAVSVNAQKTEPVVYQFDNKAETYVLGDYAAPTTYQDLRLLPSYFDYLYFYP